MLVCINKENILLSNIYIVAYKKAPVPVYINAYDKFKIICIGRLLKDTILVV
jgi:hypothetical protein